ncbi:MAG: hypothetical protein HKO96_12090 [Flavobacteriaceae bacterium]|nr:carboxypeptidase-like regulatory domain-containing protein [Bacteroidia bacterium]NNF81644.1 hypothetical protein [Flavobacteriaceae bacterium]NNK71211.1 hypothetical protein [Flavobacteriaceae bacterium]NNL79810.1 hypothetical protein [Flavobacteriaceae bacterium]
MRFLSAHVFPIVLLGPATVDGTVTEQATARPLPGVNVIIKGTSRGTATDFDGNYQLSVSNGDVLVFSYVGFVSQAGLTLTQRVTPTCVRSLLKPIGDQD